MSHHSLLIVGCGDLGQRVSALLDSNQWDITGVRRRPPAGNENINWVAADYSEAGSLDFAGQLRPDFVITSFTPTGMDLEGYQRGFADAAGNVLRGLGEHRPQHLLMVSSTRVYAESEGGWVDESSPLSSTDARAQAIIAAEQAFLSSPVPTSVIRFGGIYGDPHGRLMSKIARGQIAPAQPVRYTNRIHRDDCAGFLVHLLQLSLAGTELAAAYNGIDDDPAPAHEVESWIAATLGCVINPGQQAGDIRVSGHKRCSNALLRSTGYALRYPDYRTGYTEVCRHRRN